MHNSQLIIILQSFDKKEIRAFRKWLQSPIHNQRADVTDLFDYLMEANHLSGDKFLQKEKIFKKIFPKETFDDARIRQTMHFLLKTVEEFLIYQELREDQVRSKMALATVYRKRKLDKLFQKTIKNTVDLQQRHPYRNEHYHRNNYLIEQEKYSFIAQQKRVAEMNLQEVSDALDIVFLSDKLRQSCHILSHQAVYKTTYEIGLIEEAITYCEQKNFFHTPVIAIYYHIYKTLTDESNHTHFENLKNLIQNHGNLFPDAEIRDLYLMALNYCIRKMNTGHMPFIREAFELYRTGIEQEILTEKNSINRWTFVNAASNGILLKEFDWVENFVHKYKDLLPPNNRESLVHYTLARLHYEKQDFDKAQELLVHFEYDDALRTLNAKGILMKIYYSKGEHEALDSLLESTRSYMKRKELPGNHHAIFSNLFRLMKRLNRLNPYSKTDREKLHAEIESTKGLPGRERKWLLEQLQAIHA